MVYKITPSSTSSSSSGLDSSWKWNSPLPYLFGSLGIMVTLISVALFVLACSYRKRRLTSSSDDDAEEKSQRKVENEGVSKTAPPHIVVILAGEENPSHLAVPMWSSKHYPNHF